MFTWILLATRAPQIGQTVDWLGFDGVEVGGGRYFGHDRWVQESAPPVRSHRVAAWRPAADGRLSGHGGGPVAPRTTDGLAVSKTVRWVMPRSLTPVWISPAVELPADSAVVNVLTADLMIVLKVRYSHPLVWELHPPYTPLTRPVLGWQSVRPSAVAAANATNE